MARRKSVKFPCYIKTSYKGEKRWCYFDSDGRIARIPTHFANFLQDLVPHSLAEGTVDTYISDLLTSLTWMRNILPIEEPITFDRLIQIVTRSQIEKTLKSMSKSGAVDHTILRREVVLRRLFEWCSTQDAGPILNEHPYSEIPTLSARPGPSGDAQRDIDEFINYDIVGKLLCAMYNECERTLLQFLFDVGSRIGMAITMTADQLPKLNENQRRAATCDDYYNLPAEDLYIPIKLLQSKKRSGTAPAKVVAITLPTLKRIYKYHLTPEYMKGIKALGFKITDRNRPIFLTSNGLIWSKRNALSQFRSAVERAGLPDWMVLHSLRSGCAYLILMSEDMGRTFPDRLKEAKKQLGHAWMSTLEKHYTTLPEILLKRFQNKAKDNLKWKYLFDLYEETYLAPNKHPENRGKRKNQPSK